jgi:hypothetical protein
MNLTTSQVESLRYMRDYKSNLSVNLYDSEKLKSIIDLLEKGLVKEGRQSKVAPYRRFSITPAGKKELKLRENPKYQFSPEFIKI